MHKVIVAITTYNLEKYVAEALDSVLKQKTTHSYKIVVADDASTDGTVDILKNYQKMYPDRIELMLSEDNMGSLGNSNRLFDKIDCEYFCFLDGDDVWLDENRLQKQVDFLDEHKEYVMCAANTQYLVDGQPGQLLLKQEELGKSYSFDDYINNKMPFFHTSSIMLRNVIFKHGLPECYYDVRGTFEECALRGEDFRRIIHLQKGALYAMDGLFSYYRIHSGGIWQGSTSVRRNIESAISANYFRKYFGEQYRNLFDSQYQNAYKALMRILVLEYGMLGDYGLGDKDTYLLTSLLNDVKGQDSKGCGQGGKLKRFIRRMAYKIIL